MSEVMPAPLQITFKGMSTSSAVETRIRELTEKLSRHHNRITGCHVVVEAPSRSHNKGTTFAVRIDLVIPGHEIVVTRDHGTDHSHEDVYVALRDAFNAADRQVEDYERRRRDAKRRG